MFIRYPVGGAHFFPQEPLLSFYPGTMEGGGAQDQIDPIEQAMRARLEAADAPPFCHYQWRVEEALWGPL